MISHLEDMMMEIIQNVAEKEKKEDQTCIHRHTENRAHWAMGQA